MTRTEKRLIKLSNDRARLIKRIAAAGNKHKQVSGLQTELVRATRQQLALENRLDRKAQAA